MSFLYVFVLFRIRRQPRCTRTDTLVPDTTLCRSPRPVEAGGARLDIARVAGAHMRRHLAQGAATLDLRPVEHDRLILDLTTDDRLPQPRSEEHTSELQSLMRHSYAVF